MANWDEWNAAASRGISAEAQHQAAVHLSPSRHLQPKQFGSVKKAKPKKKKTNG